MKEIGGVKVEEEGDELWTVSPSKCELCTCSWLHRRHQHGHSSVHIAPVGAGAPLFPLSIYFLIFSPFYFFLSFLGFTYFLLLSIPSLSTRIVPLRFQAGGHRRRPNLGLVCVLCVLLVLSVFLSWDALWCFVLFGLVTLVLCVPSVLWHCWLGHLTRKNPSPIWPIMCLVGSLTQSVNQSNRIPNLTNSSHCCRASHRLVYVESST